jgi:hypothetical protein
MQKAGPAANVRFHDMHHCAATALRRAGVDNTTAMAIIGQRRCDATDLRAAAAKLNTPITLSTERTEANS